jgi:hypothetical protein
MRVASLVSLCSVGLIALGCSRDLDRTTAERLIRGAGDLPGASIEFGLRSPAFIESTPGQWPPLWRATDETRWDVAFIDKLVSAGVLVWHAQRTYPSGNGGLYGTITDRRFSAIPQPFVSESNDYVTLTLAAPALTRVTGVTQEKDSSGAVAEAEIGLKPTPLYERLLPIVSEMLDRCRFLPKQPYSCQYWPQPEKFTQTTTQRFLFRRYDDGWRLEPNRSYL